jgi:hypothetical protein
MKRYIFNLLLLLYSLSSFGQGSQDVIVFDWWGNSSTQTESFLYPSTDRALRYGTGAKPYITFGDGAINQTTGRIFYIYREAVDHNASGDGDIYFSYSDDGGLTLSAKQLILADPDGVGTINLTSVCVGVTSTQRVIFFYSKQTTGSSIIYFKYSDDHGATLSSEIRLTTNFDPGYIDATGSCIEIGGVLYKSCWTSLNTVLYTSSDNGLTWTFKSFISGAETSDEASLVYYGSTLYCFARNNGLHRILVYKSTNLGTTWSAYEDTGIPSQGKPPSGVTPDGKLFGLGREYTTIPTEFASNRTILWQSNADRTSYTWQFIDGRTAPYMYGFALWHNTLNRVVSIWSDEVQNSPFGTRALIISKDIEYSSTPVAPPTVYDPDYQSILDFSHVDGITVPSNATKLIDSNFLAGGRTDGWLEEFDALYMPMANNASLEQFYRRNMRKAWLSLTPTNTPTYGVNGYDFNGTDEYLVLATELSNMTKFTQNSASVVYYTSENVQGNPSLGVGGGSFSLRTDGTFLNPRNNSDLLFYSINGGALQSVSNTNSIGLYIIKRLGSTAIEAWKDPNGSGIVNIASHTVTSTGRATFPLHVGAERFADGVFLFGTKNCGFIGIGSGMDGTEASISTRFFTRKTALGL